MKNKTTTVKPGQTVQDSGIYRSGDRRATMVKGEPAPPTQRSGQRWVQVVDTNPKDGRKK
ncbi:MAG: YjzC family protein [Pyrinomonadaceae bacterium]